MGDLSVEKCPHCWGDFTIKVEREDTSIWLCFSQMCNPNNSRLLLFYHGNIDDLIPEWIVGINAENYR